MSCYLRASGANFAVDDFVKGSSLFPCDCRIYHKGEPVFPKTQPHGRVEECSGVNIKVSAAKRGDLIAQIEDTIAYLKTNGDEITRLGQFPGVEIIGLDFGIEIPDELETNYFPPELLYLAGSLGIGIELTYY